MLKLLELEETFEERTASLKATLEVVWRGGVQPSMAKAWTNLDPARRAHMVAEGVVSAIRALGPTLASQTKKLLVEVQVEDAWENGEDPALFLDLAQAVVSDKPLLAEYVRALVSETGQVPFRVDVIPRSDLERLLAYFDVVYRLAVSHLVAGMTEELLKHMGWGPDVLQQAVQGWVPELMPPEGSLMAMVEVCLGETALERMVPRVEAGDLQPGKPQVLVGAGIPRWSRDEALGRLSDIRAPWRPSFGDWRDPAWRGAAAGTLGDYAETPSARPGIVFDQEHPEYEVHHAGLLPEDDVPVELAEIFDGRAWKPIFSCGRSNTGVAFHSHASSWLCQLIGTKYWWLLPPEAPVTDLGAPWRFFARPPPGALFCALGEGEVLYIPDDWPHSTWNLDDLVLSVGRLSVR